MASLYILSRMNAMRRISRTASRDQSCVCSSGAGQHIRILGMIWGMRGKANARIGSFSQKLTVSAAWLHLASESGSQWSLLSVRSTSLKSRRGGAAPAACACPASTPAGRPVGEASTVKPTVCEGERRKTRFNLAGGGGHKMKSDLGEPIKATKTNQQKAPRRWRRADSPRPRERCSRAVGGSPAGSSGRRLNPGRPPCYYS